MSGWTPGIETVWLLPHTHWDREWYEPFQRFRMRLVDLMDDVVDRGGQEPGFRFTMDGQMAAVDDYLQVRPERTEAVRTMVASGQLAIGPWRVLMDEFLCSGETMIRNLQIGWADAARLGPVMAVGYVPDMFGHCAQLPQILRHAGIEQACVWRGVPASVEANEFWWRSPDGTGIRTEYLANGYGNAADLFADASTTRTRLAERIGAQSGPYAGPDFLAMYGTDHATPLPTLASQVEALNAGEGPVVRVATLAEYLASPRTPQGDLSVVDGELRSHARANILPGVLSVRWQLKEAMARTERLLARYAEPFASLWLSPLPEFYLDLAWRGVVDSSCHDSVTGCGVDETATQVLARIEEASHAAQAVRDRALRPAVRATPRGSLVVANPLPFWRSDHITVTVPVPEDWPAVGLRGAHGDVWPAQELDRPDRVLGRETVASPDLARLIHRVHDRELFGLQVAGIQIDAGARRLTFALADHGDDAFDAVAAGRRLAAAAEAAEAGSSWEVVTLDEPRRRLTALVPSPPLGWATLRPVRADEGPRGAAVDAGRGILDNGLVRVQVAADGTLTVTADGRTLTGVARLVDGGDCGDTYNYGPPAQDRLVDGPRRVTVRRRGGAGLIAGSLVVERLYDLPSSSDAAGRSGTTEPTLVRMEVEVRTGEPFVRLALSWENRSSDHRLRLHVPTSRPARCSHAHGQLAVVRRGRAARGGPVGEYPLPTFPAERFVDAGGMGVVLYRTMEYEVVERQEGAGTEIALTLLRAVGHLSRNVHPLRSEPAGPQVRTPDAQVLGPAHARLIVMPHRGGWATAGLAEVAEAVLHPVVVARGDGPPDAEAGIVEGLTVRGAGVDLLSVRRRAQENCRLEVRVVNTSDDGTTVTIGSANRPVRQAYRCDGLGRVGESLTVEGGVVTLPLRPWQIDTVAVDLQPEEAAGPGRR